MVLDTSLLNTQYYKILIKDKWSNPRKRVLPSPTSRSRSYWRESLQVTLDYSRPTYNYIYIYILGKIKRKEKKKGRKSSINMALPGSASTGSGTHLFQSSFSSSLAVLSSTICGKPLINSSDNSLTPSSVRLETIQRTVLSLPLKARSSSWFSSKSVHL